MAERTCSIDGCDGKIHGRGWCNKHYKRFQACGDPLGRPKVERVCSVDGCGNPHLARGWCKVHYDRWLYRGGNPAEKLPNNGAFKPGSAGHPRATDYAALFETKVDRTTTPGGCHTWTAARDLDGYGLFHVHGKQIRAHRFALQQALGYELPPDVFACHKCDNPPCVRADHLFAGTAEDNMRDMADKGRKWTRRMADGRYSSKSG